jgi:hypothetical protein
MIHADQIRLASGADILEVARRYVRLKRIATNEWAGPCPVCGGRDRFGVNARKRLWNCRGCGMGGDVISLAQYAGGLTFAEAIATLCGNPSKPVRIVGSPPARDPDDEDAARNRGSALRIWESARSIRGTLAESYLVRVRSIDIEQLIELDDVLRFEARCPFGGERLPCLIALVHDIVTDAPKAIQRTALSPDGRKIDRRSLGRTRACAIKLWPDAEVTQGLVVGEGLETTAAAATRVEHLGTLLRPAWAVLARTNLRDFPVLAGLEALTILVDADESGDGQKAASVCARRWLDAGREVIRLTPKTLGTDFDDIVRGEGA